MTILVIFQCFVSYFIFACVFPLPGAGTSRVPAIVFAVVTQVLYLIGTVVGYQLSKSVKMDRAQSRDAHVVATVSGITLTLLYGLSLLSKISALHVTLNLGETVAEAIVNVAFLWASFDIYRRFSQTLREIKGGQ